MSSFNYDFHPSDGLSHDVNVFLEEFKSKNSFQFRDFAEVWKNQNFYELILGRMSMEAIKDFLNCLFHYFVDLIQNTSDKLCQTCAMFMMYGFYGKLPSKNIVFIRVTLPQWKTINELIQFYRVEEHLDCLYIFHCLCSSGVFQFCATRQPNYPNVPLYANLNNIRAIIFKSEEHGTSENENNRNDSCVVNSLDKLSETHRQYYDYKKELFSIAKSSLGLLNKHYIDDVIDCYKESRNMSTNFGSSEQSTSNDFLSVRKIKKANSSKMAKEINDNLCKTNFF